MPRGRDTKNGSEAALWENFIRKKLELELKHLITFESPGVRLSVKLNNASSSCNSNISRQFPSSKGRKETFTTRVASNINSTRAIT